jgi:predicted hotdog family 3-hydroxylacyl-ACP dehydratase
MLHHLPNKYLIEYMIWAVGYYNGLLLSIDKRKERLDKLGL